MCEWICLSALSCFSRNEIVCKLSVKINKIFNSINNLHSKIKFTLEEESNNKLNYLDLTIKKNETNFEYAIYRKPSQTDLVIPNTSNHPPQHKMAVFNSMIYRMLRIPLNNTERNKERKIIQQIAVKNGYKIKTINKLENKIKHKITNKIPKNTTFKNSSINNNIKYTTFTYYGNITQKLNKIFKDTNLKISYNTDNIIFNKIKPKTKSNTHNKNGIYKIECPDCNKFYVGQTKKKLRDRFVQHRNAYLKPNIYKSNLATHCLNNNHQFPNIENIKLI